jgi:flavin reductase (DIM6/NTAB) family NADH-FMN oxidoreductase RutF
MSGKGAGGDLEAFDRLRRRVLWALPTGLFVVGSRAADTRNLMTCNWVMQVATSPKLVALAVESDSLTRDLIERGGSFSISLLGRSDRGLVRRFVKPVRDIETDEAGVAISMQGEPVIELEDGLPRLATSVAWLACSVRSIIDWDGLRPTEAGPSPASHVLVVGDVLAVGESDRLASPLGDDAILSMIDTRMNYGG